MLVIAICIFRLSRKLKNANYLLNIVRNLSFSLSNTHEIVIFNHTDDIVYATHSTLYRTKAEFLNKISHEYLPNDEYKAFQYNLQNNISCKLILTSEQEQKIAIGSIYALENSQSFTNEPVLIVHLIDITPFYLEKNNLRHDYKKLETFVDNLPIGIFYLNKQMQITGCNLTFSSYLKSSRSMIIGNSIRDYIKKFEISKDPVQVELMDNVSSLLMQIPATSFSSFQAFMIFPINKTQLKQDINYMFNYSNLPSVIVNDRGICIKKNNAFSKEFPNYAFNIDKSKLQSSQLELMLNNKPITVLVSHMPNNQYLLQFISHHDSEDLLQMQKTDAMVQLVGGIAHDFNNLLTAVIGFCDLLLQRYMPDDPSYGDVVQIKQNANRASNLVKQLLAFSKQQTLNTRVVSLTDTLTEVLPLLKRLLGANVNFKINHGMNLWTVKIDTGQFEQIIMNLIVNARDAMNNHGTLTIQTKNYYADKEFQCFDNMGKIGDYVLIEVIDTGCGMDAETIKHIFDPFFTKKAKASGTGLGLATVYGIIKQMEGYINVHSKVGEGTTFQVFIPRYAGPEKLTQNSKPTSYQDLSGTETVLLVEDEDSVRKFAVRALRHKGYNVIEAVNGMEALEIANQQAKIDVLITDVIMPKIDGPTLNKKIREIHKNLKTIFISGYTKDTFKQDLNNELGIHFLQKPFALQDLANKVKEALNT